MNKSTSYNIQRTRAPSHKSSKMLSSSIKIENTAIAKKERLSKSPTKSHTCTIGDVNDINYTGLVLLGTTMIAIVSLPSRQKNDKYLRDI